MSAGIREAIEAFWQRARAAARSNSSPASSSARARTAGRRTTWSSATRWATARAAAPTSCKAAILRKLRRPGDVVLVFGDGPSDLCPAREADLVFARGHLAERCEQEGLEWRPLTDFAEVLPQVDDWLASR